jgi:hypothetical protein
MTATDEPARCFLLSRDGSKEVEECAPDDLMTPTGFEQNAKSSGKTKIYDQIAAKSAAIASQMARLQADSPDIPPDVRETILGLLGAAD